VSGLAIIAICVVGVFLGLVVVLLLVL